MLDFPTLVAETMGTSMFHLDLPVLEKALRPILVYLFLVILLRIFGKRELAQLNPFDLIVVISLSNTLQNAMIGDDNSVTGGLIGAFSLCAVNYGVVRSLFRHRRLNHWIGGKPTTLIKDGKIRSEAMSQELLTKNVLLNIIHRQGFSSIEEVESCVLETGGTFSVEGRQPRRDVAQHHEILEKLASLTTQIEDLKALLRPRTDGPADPIGSPTV